MITLNRKSLHHRIYTAFGLYVWRKYKSPKNLCRYFWACVFGCLLPLTTLAILATLVIRYPLVFLMAIGEIIGIVVFIGIILGVSFLITEVLIPRFRTQHREPNLVLEYIKAKKRKICPMIEWR